ncbi:MAG: TetR/AcrR family transcriptional regulator [Thermomicrobiales bacterium]|nr:TetR/AcrR family transcriptional regulator [Thermomicrobiales bacterium]MCO5219497.1 TetR/AcrR family transcriptional regulator [Thermomicrobiales bacterium]MCO5224889.1 TetR/AcrR family transcriptional regulator [Thermomicrobiales bacterium]MCO5228469.1 TetR/AcrR family transcriptional regulator [Thermomicrobiales bacterium]
MKGAAARRERNRAEMRQSILDASHEIVAKGGIEALTIRGIAKDLGYSPGAIYDYFDSKEDIVHYLYFEGSGGLAAVMSECLLEDDEDTDVFITLERLALAYRHHSLAHSEMYRLVFGVLKQPNPDESSLGEFSLGGLETLLTVVQRGIDCGDFQDVPAIVIATSAWTAAHGFMSLEVTDHFRFMDSVGVAGVEGENAIEALFLSCMRAILRGWATPQGMTKLGS